MHNKNITASKEITGLILAGGRAKRMGGNDKGLIVLDGKCMIEHCIVKLQPQVDQIFISANRNIEEYSKYGFTVLEDCYGEHEGPLVGLLGALENSLNSSVLIVPCDAPLFSTHLAKRLLEFYIEGETLAVIPHDGTRLQTLFGLYSINTISSLKEYLQSGQRKVESWVTSLPHAIVDFSNESESFMNINTENDLQIVQSSFNKAKPVK